MIWAGASARSNRNATASGPPSLIQPSAGVPSAPAGGQAGLRASADGGLDEPVQLQPGGGPFGQGVVDQHRDGVVEGQRVGGGGGQRLRQQVSMAR